MGEKLTLARRKALEVLAAEQLKGRLARYSNTTSSESGNVYWQSADWLRANGYVYYPSGSTGVALTDEGRGLGVEHGLVS